MEESRLKEFEENTEPNSFWYFSDEYHCLITKKESTEYTWYQARSKDSEIYCFDLMIFDGDKSVVFPRNFIMYG